MTANEFEQLWECCGNEVYRFCLRLTCNRDKADDLYQDTALTAFRKSDKIELSGNPKSYIFSVAVRLAHNAFKKSQRRGENTAASVEDEEYDLADAADIEQTAENAQLRRAVRQAVAALDEKYRVPLTLYYFDEHGIDFISEVMKIPQGTVKSRLHTARELVRRHLEKEGYTNE